jgi:histidyl-tRNA synthetase
MGISRYCDLCPSIVRGLAYYTGIVFEIYASGGELRAIGGGGRYDNLLGDFGGPPITGTGFGMGDCVLEILLEEKGLLKNKPSTRSLDYFVAYADKALLTEAIKITANLRKAGLATDFSYKAGSLKKQLKGASLANSTRCIIVGQEYESGQLVVKDMATGEQETILEEKFWDKLKNQKG